MKSNRDEEGGYAVMREELTGALRVRVWGFWSAAIAGGFAAAVHDESKVPPRPSSFVLDATALKPQGEAGQTAIGAALEGAVRGGTTRIHVITSSPLTKLQLSRIVKERAPTGALTFSDGGTSKAG